MSKTNYERVRGYIVQRLAQELPAHLTYHSIHHTIDDVLPAAERLAAMEKVSGEDLLLLRTAVLFHDLGFVEQYIGHEAVSMRIASQVLPEFGYRPEQIQAILGIIQATRLPQTPQNRLGQIMADADLDVIGREDFWLWNQNLRNEHRAMGRSYSNEGWYSNQLEFLKSHAYFTVSARRLRDEQKARNLLELTQRLENCTSETYMPATNDSENLDQPLVLSISDRTAILHSVNLFAATPDDTLAEVASLLTTVDLEPGQAIFNKGEAGDSMYFIVRGQIRIHDGEMELNILGPADVFGEIALLDNQPRVASATASEKTQLLRLDQQDFYELMDQRPEVARGIIRVLNRHLRGRVHDMAEDFEYIQQVGRITSAAAALEAGTYEPAILDQVCGRTDELGQLARVFQRMANEVRAREQRLKQELQMLRIQIDEVKKAQQVAEITESEYFQELQTKIKRIKNR